MDVPAAVRARLPLKTVRPASGDIREGLRQNREIRWELESLESAANKKIRKTQPQFRSKPGEVAEALLEDLAAVLSPKDWRPAFERTADHLTQAANHKILIQCFTVHSKATLTGVVSQPCRCLFDVRVGIVQITISEGALPTSSVVGSSRHSQMVSTCSLCALATAA